MLCNKTEPIGINLYLNMHGNDEAVTCRSVDSETDVFLPDSSVE